MREQVSAQPIASYRPNRMFHRKFFFEHLENIPAKEDNRGVGGRVSGSVRLWFVSGVAASVLGACGGDGDEAPPFTYTAVPYTIVALPSGTPIAVAIGENGAEYIANEVIAIVRPDQEDAFEEGIKDLGFRHKAKVTLSHSKLSQYVIEVPAGSAVDAHQAVAKLDGVEHASLNHLLHTQAERK